MATTSEDLFDAILAMDAYNRSDNQGVFLPRRLSGSWPFGDAADATEIGNYPTRYSIFFLRKIRV